MILRTLVWVLISATGIGCSSPKKEAPVEPARETWSGKMQALSKVLTDLLPLVASKTKFNQIENFAKIESGTTLLQTLAHSLKSTQAPGNSDPSLQILSGLFAEDIQRALDGLKGGNREYARSILKDTTSYCFQCHTQTGNGPDFPHLNLDVKTNDLNLADRAEYFAATRQFSRALATYEEALADSKLVKSDPFTWETAARSALAIIVRVKENAKEAENLVAKLEKQPSVPKMMKKAIAGWKRSVKDWSKEKRPKPHAGIDLVSQAERLIETAQKRQEFPLDHSQDVLFFRAASELHLFLQNSAKPNDPLGAKALYLAGAAAEATRDMNFWTLHETYYEKCIRWLPHSAQAMKCHDRLKESITLGYSGSGGVHVPTEVARRLEEYRAIATPDSPQNR